MTSEFKSYKIKEVGRVITGKTPSTKDADNFGGEYPFITIPDLNGRVHVDSTARTVSEKGKAKLKSTLLPPQSVLMSCIATVGLTGITVKPSFTNQQINAVLPNKNIVVPEFLYYCFRELSATLKEADGTVFSNISKSRFSEYEILIPPLAAQKRILNILISLDELVSNLGQQNSVLESIAQTLFKSWFVNFDPVHAKAAGLEPDGLSSELAALFPSEFEESELGLIPKGWLVAKLADEFELVMGQSPAGSSYNTAGKGTLFFQGRSDFGFRFPEPRTFTTEPSRIAKENSVLLSVRAPVGDINVALEECCIGRGLAAITGKDKAQSFCLYSIRTLGAQLANFDNEGTVFGSINKADLSGLKVVKPTDEVKKRFEAIASRLDALIKNNELVIRTITSLRDELLPRLISGKIRIEEAEEALESALPPQ